MITFPWRRYAHLFLLLSFLCFLGTQASMAQTCQILANVETTGGVTDPLSQVGETNNGINICPGDPTDGCDFDADDLLVRSGDIVAYTFAYSVNSGPTDNVTIEASLPEGYVWELLPGFCVGAGSGISGDGTPGNPSSITCNIGNVGVNEAKDLPFLVRVLNDTPNGDSWDVTAEISSDDVACADSDTSEEVVVTAAPHWNLEKRKHYSSVVTHNGVVGYRTIFNWIIEVPDAPYAGNTPPMSPLTWTDDTSALCPNAELMYCDTDPQNEGLPFGSYDASQPDRSVLDSGTATCTQAGIGSDISVTLNGGDFSLSHYPTRNANGSSLPASDRIASVGEIAIFCPAQDVVDAGGTLNMRNTFTDFDGNTENPDDNGAGADLEATDAYFSKGYVDESGSSVWSSPPFDATSTRSGDGHVQAGQQWATDFYLGNQGAVDLNNACMCDVIDLNTYFLTSPIDIVSTGGTGVAPGYTVEYATGYVGTWPSTNQPNPAALLSECQDPGIGWNADPVALGGISTVTKVKVCATDPIPPGGRIQIWLSQEAKDNPVGTILQNQATAWDDDFYGPEGYDCWYDSTSDVPNQDSCADRLTQADALVRIDKKTDDPNDPTPADDGINATAPGLPLTWVLEPVFTSAATNAAPDLVTVTDVIPAGLIYTSATPAPTSVTPGPGAGETTLVWQFPGTVPNLPMAPITVTTLTDLFVTNLEVLTNTVVVESPSDPSSEADRTAERPVQVTVPSGILTIKEVDVPVIPVGDIITYTLTYANRSTSDINEIQIIDVLPWNGDGRVPATDYTGTYDVILPLALPPGVTAEYTAAPSATISSDPTDPTNSDGSIVWCPALGVAPCPVTATDITGIRFTDSNLYPANDPPRELEVKIDTDGNLPGDIYTNNFGTKGDTVTLPVFSNDVTTTVVGAALGGTLWCEDDNDGTYEAGTTEPPMVSVEVCLFAATDDPCSAPALQCVDTDATGSYFFDFLPEGDYVVSVSDAAFLTGAPLEGYESSYGGAAAVTPDPDTDVNNDDNGEEGVCGVLTTPVTIEVGQEPTGDGTASTQTPDNSTNLTVDLGFTPKVLPVELVAFEALAGPDEIELTWETASEWDNAGFSVEYKLEDADFEEMTWIESGSSNVTGATYSHKLSEPEPGRYTFRLKQIDLDGSFEYSREIEVVSEVVGRFFLRSPYPNPFNPQTTVRFATAESEKVTVAVYDAVGRRVATLFEGVAPSNKQIVVQFDASELTSGAYFLRLMGNGFGGTKKMLLVK